MEGTGEVRCSTRVGRVERAAATVLIRVKGLTRAIAADNSAVFLRIQAIVIARTCDVHLQSNAIVRDILAEGRNCMLACRTKIHLQVCRQ